MSLPRRADDLAWGALRERIHVIRGQRVMLDADLAALYGVATMRLNEAVSRNRGRFPDDFMFRLTAAEAASLKSQSAISKPGRGGRHRSTPRAFTEQGVAMLSSVLRSPRAVAVNIEVMRAFVRLRRASGEYAELVRRIAELEQRFGREFALVFSAIRELQRPAAKPRAPIGFRPGSSH